MNISIFIEYQPTFDFFGPSQCNIIHKSHCTILLPGHTNLYRDILTLFENLAFCHRFGLLVYILCIPSNWILGINMCSSTSSAQLGSARSSSAQLGSAQRSSAFKFNFDSVYFGSEKSAERSSTLKFNIDSD